jgi:hypothetical protein
LMFHDPNCLAYQKYASTEHVPELKPNFG